MDQRSLRTLYRHLQAASAHDRTGVKGGDSGGEGEDGGEKGASGGALVDLSEAADAWHQGQLLFSVQPFPERGAEESEDYQVRI